VAGIVHWLWSDRWGQSRELEEAAQRLERIPDVFREGTADGEDSGWGPGVPSELDAASLTQAGARGAWLRRFTHKGSGATVTVILLCGRPGRTSVHRPEHCYRGAGFEMDGPAVKYAVGAPGVAPAEFWTARFSKPETGPDGPVQLRIFWSWFAAGAWQAPASPRLVFARYPALYKLYVVRELASGQERVEDDPCVPFLQSLVPELVKALSPP